MNFTSGSAFVGSLLALFTTGDVLVNLSIAIVLGFVAYWIAVTPERVIDVSDGGDEYEV